MIALNLLLTILVSLATVYLLQEKFLSLKTHRKDGRYKLLRGFVVLVALAVLATNLEPFKIGIATLVLNSSIAIFEMFLIRKF